MGVTRDGQNIYTGASDGQICESDDQIQQNPSEVSNFNFRLRISVRKQQTLLGRLLGQHQRRQ